MPFWTEDQIIRFRIFHRKTKQTFIEPGIAIGRVDEEPITEKELDIFIDKFINFLDENGYECGGYFKIISEDD